MWAGAPRKSRRRRRVGRALVTEGALVGQGDATQLALMQQLDPVYVNVTQSSADLLKLQQAMAAGQLRASSAILPLA